MKLLDPQVISPSPPFPHNLLSSHGRIPVDAHAEVFVLCTLSIKMEMRLSLTFHECQDQGSARISFMNLRISSDSLTAGRSQILC